MLTDTQLLRFGWGLAVLAVIVALVLIGASPMLLLALVGFLPRPTQLAPPRRRPPDRPQIPRRSKSRRNG